MIRPARTGTVELRATGPEDFGVLRTLFDDPSFHGWGGAGRLSDDAIRSRYCGSRWPGVECYLVSCDSVPVGLAQLHEAGEGEGGGVDLILVPDARGRGVGRAAADLLVRRARGARGWKRITVDPDADNVRGIRFWRAIGFRPTREVADDPEREEYLLMDWQGN